MQFKEFKLKKSIQNAVLQKGYKEATLIQERVIPLVLEKKDLVVMAQTGSGKSASFILPLLEMWSEERDNAKKGKIRILVLAPTRELTLQISTLFEEFSSCMGRKPQIVSLIGGDKIGEQLFSIQQGCDILLATTGRFLDVLTKKQMNLSHLHALVLDEADKMLGLNFMEELDLVLEALPQKRQTLLFSATYPTKMQELVEKMMSHPQEIKLEESPVVEKITQRVIEVDAMQRAPLLRKLIQENSWKLILVFMANKRATDNLAYKFRKHGFSAASFNGDLEQELRVETLLAFKEGKINILFATDIAARGLDIERIDCVVNYDLPRSPKDYIHRIGRTARAGKSGIALSFIDHQTQEHFKLIEKRAKLSLLRESIKGFELQGEAPKKLKGKAPIKGKKKSKKDKLREKQAQENAIRE